MECRQLECSSRSSLECHRKRSRRCRGFLKLPRPQVVHLPLAPRRRNVTRADLRKYGVTLICAACSDIAVHGKIATHHTEECRKRIGKHYPEGHERLQVHKRRRDAEPELQGDQAKVGREDEGDPALLEEQDAEMPVEVSSASVKRGADAVDDDEERARLRVRAEGK